jgi:hypothetical protein
MISAALIGSLGSIEVALVLGAVLVFLARRASRDTGGGGAPPRPPAVVNAARVARGRERD